VYKGSFARKQSFCLVHTYTYVPMYVLIKKEYYSSYYVRMYVPMSVVSLYISIEFVSCVSRLKQYNMQPQW
jgi:hypothetical protein